MRNADVSDMSMMTLIKLLKGPSSQKKLVETAHSPSGENPCQKPLSQGVMVSYGVFDNFK
jgi:hypothetical protein